MRPGAPDRRPANAALALPGGLRRRDHRARQGSLPPGGLAHRGRRTGRAGLGEPEVALLAEELGFAAVDPDLIDHLGGDARLMRCAFMVYLAQVQRPHHRLLPGVHRARRWCRLSLLLCSL